MKKIQSNPKIKIIFYQFPVALKQIIFLLFCLLAVAEAQTLTLPAEQRPDWLRRDGIVMAGSWEPLLFRVRRDGSNSYSPTDQQRADYQIGRASCRERV